MNRKQQKIIKVTLEGRFEEDADEKKKQEYKNIREIMNVQKDITKNRNED